MSIQMAYADARTNLDALLDRVVEDREVVYISRRGLEDVALVAASELRSLLETAHLLRSPKNAKRFLTAFNRALARKEKPNRTTLKTFRDTDAGKNVVRCKDAPEMFNRLGI